MINGLISLQSPLVCKTRCAAFPSFTLAPYLKATDNQDPLTMPVDYNNNDPDLNASDTRCSCDERIRKVLQFLCLGCISLLDCILNILDPLKLEFMLSRKLFLSSSTWTWLIFLLNNWSWRMSDASRGRWPLYIPSCSGETIRCWYLPVLIICRCFKLSCTYYIVRVLLVPPRVLHHSGCPYWLQLCLCCAFGTPKPAISDNAINWTCSC